MTKEFLKYMAPRVALAILFLLLLARLGVFR